MRSGLRLISILAVLVAITACAAMRQQKAQIRADQGQFHNLQVLPQNITHDELIATMRNFARSLGTRCDHCHAPAAAGSKDQFDFPSDAKPEKNVGRAMLRMTRSINAEYISKVNAHGQTVTCLTCHRGHTVPEIPPANEGRPQQPPGLTPPPPPQP